MLKKIKSTLIKLAWYVGGQKAHNGSNIKVPPAGYVAPSAEISFGERVFLGDSTLIMPGARLICAGMPPYLEGSGKIIIGADSIIREQAFLQTYGGTIKIGRDCTVNPFCVLSGDITIGNSVLIAAHVQMFASNHIFERKDLPIRTQGVESKGISIGDDVWIGAGAIILDGVSIREGAVIAAGSVVNKDVDPFSVIAGAPGRCVKMRG
jgi:acetyltransferase-like isoleucine patch superfamily enzyme